MIKCCGVHALRIIVGITMLALLLGGGASAATITVNASGSGDYSRIQDAIDNASAGDTILVYGGIYHENVNVTKQLTLRGIGNPVVDAGGSGSAITLAADGIALEGFTATGSGYEEDAGIKVISDNNTLSGNNALNNRNGIYIFYSSNNTLTCNNASYNRVNGISLEYSSNNTLTGNNASNNFYQARYATSGNGITLSSSSNNKLKGNNASNNYDGGIFLESSSNNSMIGNVMTGNKRNFDLEGDIDSDFDNQIDKSNLVDGRPIYYIINASGTTYDSSINAGTFYCIGCINVTIKNLNLNNNGKGIYLKNTSQSRIQNVTASNNGIGISLSHSSNNSLNDNNASNNIYNDDLGSTGIGISLESSCNNTLNRNNASFNYFVGIGVYSSSNNTFSENNVSNNWNGYRGAGEGISMFSSDFNTLRANNVSNNDLGISLRSSSNNKLSDNNASNNGEYGGEGAGISLRSSGNNTMIGNVMTGNKRNFNLEGDIDSDFDNQIDTTNLVDGKPLYYIIRAFDTTYDSSTNAGTLYCISCVNVTIKNLNLKGLYFWNASKSRIHNVNASNNDLGISLGSSSNNTLIGNNGSIYLEDSSNNTLRGNNASNNDFGISLSGSSNNTLIGNNGSIYLEDSSNNLLIGNNVSNNWNYGILMRSCRNNTLTGNNASNSQGSGIYLSDSWKNKLTGNKASNNYIGIYLTSSNNNTLTGNIITSNNQMGFYLEASSNNTLRENNASDNGVGIIVRWYSSNKNIIYNNIFNNINNVVINKPKNNTWNTTRQSDTNIIGGSNIGGNFWGNPNGTGFSQTCTDLDNDGICDKIYIINSKNIDYLPLSMNFTKDRLLPKISFTEPTPEDGAILAQNYTIINTTISNASTAFIDWNGSLVGWWRFNNEKRENKTFFRDWSNRENNAKCSGTNCPVDSSGKFGNALRFDGVNDYLDAGKKSNLNIKSAITIEAWINPSIAQEKCWDGISGNYGVLSKAGGPENSANWSWQLRYGAPDNCYLGFQFNGNPEGNKWVTVKQNLTANQWYHIAGTFNGIEIKSYLNGKLKDTNKISAIKGYHNKLLIGNDGWANYFSGKIDDVRIHRRALSPEEIKASYDAGRYGLYRNFTNLAKGNYNYRAFVQNVKGSVNQTEKRTLGIIPSNME